jgi:alpha-glucosidase
MKLSVPRPFLLGLSAALLVGSAACAQWRSIGALDRHTRLDSATVELASGGARLRIQAAAPGVLRVRLAPSGRFEPDSSWAVAHRRAARLTLTETTDGLRLAAGALTVHIRRDPIRLTFLDGQGRIIAEDDSATGMAWNGTAVRVWKRMPQDEFYFGFGEKSGRLLKRGAHMTMWNSDIPAYGADTDPLYQSIPFFYSVRVGRAHGTFFDNSHWSSFDMGKEARDRYSFGAEAGELNYYVFAGPSPADVLGAFTALTGRMPLPPLWSLGYQQSRWSYPTERRVREIADGFRSRKIPCDVIYLDIDYMDGYRIFTWNRESFPDPAGLVRDLRKQGFRTAVIVDPGIKADTAYEAYRTGLAGGHFLEYPDGRVYIGKVWPGECAFPDYSSAAGRRWWGENFRDLVRTGVRGWWNDMNEPSVFDVPTKTVDLNVIHSDEGRNTTHARNHNLYGMQMTQATYDGVRRLLPDERPFLLTRASYAGGHRTSAAWTGDNVSSWEHLRMSVAMCLNLSVSGQPFVGADIGGFIGYPGGELFARWLQLGVFTPLMRAHSVINEKNKEPWEYGEEFTRINRETINLRYRLLPLIYTEMERAARTGIPPMRPLVFDYPEDGAVLFSDTEFLFGEHLLVAPVVEAGRTERSLRLPAGTWYDFWTGRRYEGSRNITVPAPLDRIPVLVRAGAVLPTRQVVQYTDEAPIDPLTLTVYPADLQATASTYEDDGLSFAYERGVYFRRRITQWNSSSATTLTLGAAEGSWTPPRRAVVVRFLDTLGEPSGVELDGRPLARSEPGSERVNVWWYEAEGRTAVVRLAEARAERRVRVVY